MTVKEKIKEIEHALTAWVCQNVIKENLGLLAGYPGVSLFYYANYLLTHDERNLEMMEKIIADSFMEIDGMELTPYFCNGLGGFAYLINFYKKNDILEGAPSLDENLKTIDQYLFHWYKHTLKVKNFDFLHGGEGLLNYFLFLNRSTDVSEMYVKRLDELKVSIPGKGIAWKSNVSYEGGNKLVYNLGLAHGMASTLIMLAKILKKESVKSKKLARELLVRLVAFFLSEKLEKGYRSTFPNYSSLDEKPRRSRLGWCYGDPGICIALWKAGDALQDNSIRKEAVEICLRTIGRKTQEETGILDSGLCHGSTGVAHIYQRMFRLSGRGEFEEASAYWLKESLKMARFHDGLAGYSTWRKDGRENKANLLDGISGIGLALISSQIKKELNWDDCLLLSAD